MMRAVYSLIAASSLAVAVPASASERCDESCLLRLADAAVEAVAAKDFRRLPWADPAAGVPVQFTENNVPLMIGDAWWGSTGSTVGQKAFSLADPDTGNVVWFGTIWDHDAPAFGAVRLEVTGGKIAEMELIAARKPTPVPFGNPGTFALSPSMTTDVADGRPPIARTIDRPGGQLPRDQAA